MPHWQTYDHLVWATRNREPMLVGDRITVVDRAFHRIAIDKRAFLHAVGVMPDHVHVAVSIPPPVSVSEFVRLLKGGSSHLLNHGAKSRPMEQFAWQAEFGVSTFAKSALQDVVNYIQHQESHHLTGQLWPGLEHAGDETGA